MGQLRRGKLPRPSDRYTVSDASRLLGLDRKTIQARMTSGRLDKAQDQLGGRGPWVDGAQVELARGALLDRLGAVEGRSGRVTETPGRAFDDAHADGEAADEGKERARDAAGAMTEVAMAHGQQLHASRMLLSRVEELSRHNARLREQLVRAQDDGLRTLRMLRDSLGSVERSFSPDDPQLISELTSQDI